MQPQTIYNVLSGAVLLAVVVTMYAGKAQLARAVLLPRSWLNALAANVAFAALAAALVLALSLFVDGLKGDPVPRLRSLGLALFGLTRFLFVPITVIAAMAQIPVLRARAAGRRYARERGLPPPSATVWPLTGDPPVHLRLEDKISFSPSRFVAFAMLIGKPTAVTEGLSFFNRTIGAVLGIAAPENDLLVSDRPAAGSKAPKLPEIRIGSQSFFVRGNPRWWSERLASVADAHPSAWATVSHLVVLRGNLLVFRRGLLRKPEHHQELGDLLAALEAAVGR